MFSAMIEEFCQLCAFGNVQRVSQLLSQMTPFDLRSAMLINNSALYLAVSNNQIDVCKMLLQQTREEHRKVMLEGINFNSPQQKPMLNVACEKGFDEIVKLLLENGAVVFAEQQHRYGYGFHPASYHHCFLTAYLNNHMNICALLRDFEISTTGRDFMSVLNNHSGESEKALLLQTACSRGDHDMAKLFLCQFSSIPYGAGVKINPATSAFGIACSRKDFAMMELFLIVNNELHSLTPLLFTAVASGDVDCVSFMLQNNCLPLINNITSFEYLSTSAVQCTPLELACMVGSLPIIHLLESHGAVSRSIPYCKELQYACERGHTAVAEYWLLDKGALFPQNNYFTSFLTVQTYAELGCDLVSVGYSIESLAAVMDHDIECIYVKLSAMTAQSVAAFRHAAEAGLDCKYNYDFIIKPMQNATRLAVMQEQDLIWAMIEKENDYSQTYFTSLLLHAGNNNYNSNNQDKSLQLLKTYFNAGLLFNLSHPFHFDKFRQCFAYQNYTSLIKGGVDINQSFPSMSPLNNNQVFSRMTLLIMACANTAVKSVQTLLEAGADPNQQDELVGGPLHWAARSYTVLKQRNEVSRSKSKIQIDVRQEIIQLLLAFGADPYLPNNSGETALHAWGPYPRILKLLIQDDTSGDMRGKCKYEDKDEDEHDQEVGDDEIEVEEVQDEVVTNRRSKRACTRKTY